MNWSGPGSGGPAMAGGSSPGRSAGLVKIDLTPVDRADPTTEVRVVKNVKDLYRFGFNGQEKDNEIYGRGTHYYAPNWGYDSRTGRRWNRDPVVKPYRSSYDAFDNSPIWKVDPLGDDDYYNRAGKFIGSDGTGNAIRLTSAMTPEEFASKLNSMGIEDLRAVTREVKIDPNNTFDIVMKDIKESVSGTIEYKAYMVLDYDNATLEIVKQPIAPGDNSRHSQNKADIVSYPGVDAKYGTAATIEDNSSKVIVGQVHSHPEVKAVETTTTGTVFNFEPTKPGSSEDDATAAKKLGVPVHIVENSENVQRVNPDGKKEEVKPDPSIMTKSLEISGGKSK